MKQIDLLEIRALFTKAGVGQDGTCIHFSFETKEEADKAFEYFCEHVTVSESTKTGVALDEWTAAWKVFHDAAKTLHDLAGSEGDTVQIGVKYKMGRANEGTVDL